MPLAQGKIFYYSLEAAWDTPPHPKIVFAIKDGTIAFVHTTKNKHVVENRCKRVENKWRGQPLNTMVFVPAGCCPEITEDCWVDCSQAKGEEETLLLTDRSFHPTTSSIPAEILEKILVGVSSSHLVSDKIRKMARNVKP
jgi:hypothetical protein